MYNLISLTTYRHLLTYLLTLQLRFDAIRLPRDHTTAIRLRFCSTGF